MSVPIKIPGDVEAMLLAASRNLLPKVPEIDLSGMEERVLERLKRLLFEFSPFNRFGFIWGGRLFEWCPGLFGFGFHRFSIMVPDRQMRYIKNWENSSLFFKREFFKAIRGLINMVFYSEKKVWVCLGYDPEPHMAERIKLREEILKRNEESEIKQEQKPLLF